MSPLNPDLAALLPPINAEVCTVNLRILAERYPTVVTAFALAVARAERERCVEAWYDMGDEEDYDMVIRALPDPDWSVTP